MANDINSTKLLDKRPSYQTLFNDNKDLYCLPGSPEANDGPLAYLVDLYQQALAFENTANEESARFISQRRPDIEKLLLDSKSINEISSILPLIIEVLAQKAQSHLNNNQSLAESLAKIHYPFSLPFHFPLRQTTAVLEKKKIPLLELIQQADRAFPNFIDNNLHLPSLQKAMVVSNALAPELQTLLLEASSSTQQDFFAKYYGVSGDAAQAASALSQLTVFTQQTGLTSQDVERLLAVNGLTESNETHSSVTFSSNVTKPSNTNTQFPSGTNYGAVFINGGTEPAMSLEKITDKATGEEVVWIKGINNDRFDRIQRFLHIQHALKLSYEQLDQLLTSALRAEKQQNLIITESTLRTLGVFLHFHREYKVTVEQFCTFIDEITPYALDNNFSFFDRLFNSQGLSKQAASASVLNLDNSEFDPAATEGSDALTVNQLCVGLNINDITCQTLLSWITASLAIKKPTRSLTVISALYRLVSLPRLLKLPLPNELDLFLLLERDNPGYLKQLAGIPVLKKIDNTEQSHDFDILDAIVAFMNAAQWLKLHRLSAPLLNILLTPYNISGNVDNKIKNIDFSKVTEKILPDLNSGLLSEDKIATVMVGFQHKEQTNDFSWLTALSELIDSQGIIKAIVIPEGKTLEEILAEKVRAILQPLADETAWLEYGDNWSQNLTTLIQNAFIAQDDMIIKSVSYVLTVDETLALPLLQWTGKSRTEFLSELITQYREIDQRDSQLSENAVAIWYDLSRYATVSKLFKLSAIGIQTLLAQPTWFGLNLADGHLRPLDLTVLHRLSRYGDWLDLLPETKTEDDILYYLNQANKVGKPPQAPDEKIWTPKQAADNLAELIGWSSNEILRVTHDFNNSVAQSIVGISFVLRLQALTKQSELSVQPLLDVAQLTLKSNYDIWQQVGSALLAACSPEEQASLESSLNESWRDALVHYLLGQWVPANEKLIDISDIDALSTYFLTDLQVTSEVKSSRIAFCIASLQNYLFRLFSHLEPGYGSMTIPGKHVENWNRYLSQYAHWQAWQKQRNFPENSLDSAQRIRRTHAFTDLENDLNQSRLNNDMIQTAILRYLTEFERLSNLQLVSGYIDGTDPKSDQYHFIGKNNTEPVEYYWRTLDITLRDNQDRISPLAWSEWEKITLSLTGDLLALRPVVIAGRQYAVWVEREPTPLLGADQKPSVYRAINVKFVFKQSNGEWSAPNKLFSLDGRNANGEYPKLPGIDQRVPDNLNPYMKDESYKPGLIAMVDIQRQNDPWMGVLLYDTAKQDSSTWIKNKDYYLELRDLLLIDKKILSATEEKNLISTWYKFYRDPGTLQHQYAGSLRYITLKADDNNHSDLKLTAGLNADRTKIILTGINTTSKRNPKGFGTLYGTYPYPSFMPSQQLTWLITNQDFPITVNITAQNAVSKSITFQWQGQKPPTKILIIYYGETQLFELLPKDWKDNKITKEHNFGWVGRYVFQQSKQSQTEPVKKLAISVKGEAPFSSIDFNIQDNWEYTASRLTISVDASPSPKVLFSSNISLNGKATGNITFPIESGVNRYSFILTATNEVSFFIPNNPEYFGEIKSKYIVTIEEIDKTPPVILRRNNQQAQYLDIQALKFPYPFIRLNTLFGTQLVARATQSIERVLAWDTQQLSEPPLGTDTQVTPVDFRGANGQYFWELFFHLPFLVSSRLGEERRYYDARRWLLEYLFDPYGGRLWNSRPLNESGRDLPSFVSTDDPDVVAYSLPVYYQKALFQFLIKLWIQEGDDLYRQLTSDSLNEANLCYQQALQLLGSLPEGLTATRWHPISLEEIKTSLDIIQVIVDSDFRAVDGYFMSPFNIRLIEYQKILESRLYNLRHGLTLDGKALSLALYAGSFEDIDNLIQRRKGNIPSTFNSSIQPIPPYRFPLILKHASDAVKQLIQLGNRLFDAIKSEISAKQDVLEQSQIIKLSAFTIELQQEAIQIAQAGKVALEASKNMAQQRYEHYYGLYEENLSSLEISAIALRTTAEVTKTTAIPFHIMSAGLEVLPNIFGFSVGGGKYAAPVISAALVSELTGSVLETTADRIQDMADYQRRRQDWEIEWKQAQSELNIIDNQLKEQELLIKTAQTALREAQAQRDAATELYEFMTTGFLTVPTYQWLMKRLSALYAPAYDAVLSLCLMAEAGWRYEVGDYQRQSFIDANAWNDSYQGLLAGESLQLNLQQMETSWLQRHERRLNIKKTISLSTLYSISDITNQITGKQALDFTLNARVFDKNYPGHYLRQIKRVSVSLSLENTGSDTVVTPEICAVLTQTGSSTLVYADIEGVSWLYDPTRKAGSNKNITTNLRAQQQITLSSVQEDDGRVATENWLCTLMFDDGRYLPFEGT
ncbi:Tc toxin subunit A, partial [Photorhabdus namnaonensis]